MKRLLTFGALFLGLLFTIQKAEAQHDMWDALSRNSGLYSPHINNCDSTTEVFLSVGAGNVGFCLEKDDRNANIHWEDARQTCANDGKRLPTVAEYVYSCDTAPSGLVNMSGDDFEWLEAPPMLLSNALTALVVVPAAGGTSCNDMTWGDMGVHTPGGGHDSASFRCLR